MLMAGRFIAGLAIGCLSMIVPLYQMSSGFLRASALHHRLTYKMNPPQRAQSAEIPWSVVWYDSAAYFVWVLHRQL
jgi:hypothetical protein